MSVHHACAHVAIIEDDDLERAALARVLHAGGFEADLFESAETYIAAAQNRQWLCLIVDVNLTGMSGVELQHKLRAEGSDVPIIIVTGNTSDIIRKRAEHAGCLGFLGKPFPADALLGLLGSIATPVVDLNQGSRTNVQ